ncbi:hypothetical protein QBC35DRAFT_382802 [Podospora australis]|uniref:Glycoside Hydrolase Family 23 n=1 Tax=Podospora australis TaxID=1536484 RepID=A0AAN6WTZ3_9PEZI|nr:hypothetical protein QBC35DRAFT_382802 [Podospora australis]
MYTYFLTPLFLSGLVAGSPLVLRQTGPGTPTTGNNSTGTPSTSTGGIDMAAAIKAIMPSSNTCSGAQVPDDCRTADQAAPFIVKSYADFSPGELAGVLALMGLESVDFKFKHNVSPGRPGQGTANMMMPNFVSQYAASIFGEQAVAGQSPDAILSMVTVDEHNFGSAGWFLKTFCEPGIQDSLKTGTDAGFQAYMGCVGVDGNDSTRLEYWNRAKAAFNL